VEPILVTGTRGFIGSHVVNGVALAFPERQVYALIRGKSAPKFELPNISTLTCDLLESDLKKTLPSSIHTLLHFAAISNTFLANDDVNRQFFNNLLMTSALVKFAKSTKVKIFGLASSVYIYSGLSSTPFKEDHIEIPGESLGASKIAAEAILKMYAFQEEFRSIAYRIFTVYGPGSRATQFIPQAIKKLKSKEETVEFGSATIKRDFIYIDDVVNAVVTSLKNTEKFDLFEPLNVGTGVATPIGDVVKNLAKLLGTSKKIRFTQNSLGKSDLDHCADIEKMARLTGWEPNIDLQTGLKKTLKSYLG
jgi:nucleoside-diphosphate-sugar epimerase